MRSFQDPRLIAKVFRDRAEEMETIAAEYKHAETRRMMRTMAASYWHLADLVEKEAEEP